MTLLPNRSGTKMRQASRGCEGRSAGTKRHANEQRQQNAKNNRPRKAVRRKDGWRKMPAISSIISSIVAAYKPYEREGKLGGL